MMKKWSILILISILLFGVFASFGKLKVYSFNSNCKHSYISNVITMSEGNVEFGVTDANYIEDEDGDGFIEILAVIDTKNIDKENHHKYIELGYKFKNYDDEVQYEKLSDMVSTPSATEDWRIWLHNNDIGHVQLSIQEEFNINTVDIESFVVTVIENKYTLNETKYEIEIPIDKVLIQEDFTVFNKEKFDEYYNKINSSYSRNQIFTVEVKEFMLEGYEFVGQIELKNISDYDLENLSVFINPIQNTGFGYIQSKFDTESGYVNLKSGESKVLDFKLNIDEATKDLYFTKKFYKSSSLKEGENIILAIGVTGVEKDPNLVLSDSSVGTYIYYFKDKLKVKEKVRTEEEEEEFKLLFDSDLMHIDYSLEEYDFEKAREILDKYLNESGEYKEKVEEYIEKIDYAEDLYKN